MAKLAKPEGKEREIVPADSYDSWCYGSVELGTQDGEFEGTPNQAKKVLLFFEIPELPITYEKDGVEVTAPQVIHAEFTNSSGKKAKIRPILEGWVGKEAADVDLAADLIGRPARISVVAKVSGKGSTYAKVTTIAKCKDKDVKDLPAMHNKPMAFSVDDDGFESANFNAIYDWVKDKIKLSHEYQEFSSGPADASANRPPVQQTAAGAPAGQNYAEDDIPF